MFTRLPDRPWGRMWMLGQCPWLWVKLIHVYRNQRTSLQYHSERSEWHWRLGWPWLRRSMWCKVIRCNRLHRMYQGWYIEVAWGLPRECDIVRMSDDYGRYGRTQ